MGSPQAGKPSTPPAPSAPASQTSAPAVQQSVRLGNVVSFSEAGGVEIEENWDQVKTVTLPTGAPASPEALAPLTSGLPLELRPAMEEFLQACYAVRGKRRAIEGACVSQTHAS